MARPPIKKVQLANYRCFGAEQTVSIAPLTLLVGDNSTGKTSFLAAVRAAWQVAYGSGEAGFNSPPFQLGSYSDIAHRSGIREKVATSFEVGFTDWLEPRSIDVSLTFSESSDPDRPSSIRWRRGTSWIHQDRLRGRIARVDFGVGERKWSISNPPFWSSDRTIGPELLHAIEQKAGRTVAEDLNSLIAHFDPLRHRAPYAGAPIRASPDRIYSPAASRPDPWGTTTPQILADICRSIPSSHRGIEAFGTASGLFDEVDIHRLNRSDDAPFQVVVRKYDRRKRKGPKRNLVDVGFGVSQVLPVLTEMYRTDSPDLFLLQQPEVHLHPSAQAALGTLFCEVAASDRQVLVETHSDYLLDRVRMDVRDGCTALKPEDASVLFFEREGHTVRMHPLRFDQNGNVLDAPPGYRQFFMDETRRSVGL